MDERTALAVTAVRAVETADRARAVWTDDDRAWASRAAAQVVGAEAGPAAFIARRALLAFERLRERRNAVCQFASGWRWRPWVGVALVALAFACGVATDWIGGAQRINIVYSPVLPLVLWNVAIYIVLAAGFVVRYGEVGPTGPLRRGVAWLAGTVRTARVSKSAADDPSARAVAAFAADWTARATPLYAARAARVLHFAAAALAAGVIASMYARGLALEYRASWESTFLDASMVRTLVAALYATGAAVTRITIPDVAQIAAIRAPGSENAAQWLHLMSATLLFVVIVPRLALAAAMGVIERHRAARLIDDVGESYFQRVLRGFHQGPVTVHAAPYSFAVSPEALATLNSLLAPSLGGNVTLRAAPPVAYGDEDAPLAIPDDTAPLVALFNGIATPEREAHGRWLAALAARRGARVVVVDESAFNARWPDDARRRDDRRRLWRDFAADERLDPVFVDLAHPDVEAAAAAFDRVFDAPPP